MRETDPAAFRAIVHHATSEAMFRAQALGFSGPPPATGENEHDDPPSKSDAFVGIIPALIKAAKVLLVIMVLLLSSIFLYALFYVAIIMPGPSATQKLYFDYSGIAKHPVKNLVLPKTHFRYQNPYLLSKAPWAVADFFAQHSPWEAYHEDLLPAPLFDSNVFQAGKPYEIEVSLEVPESKVNHQSGVLSVLVELLSSEGTMLATSVRSTKTIPHETNWISTIRKGILLGPILLGAAQEIRTVQVPSFRYLIENEDLPLRYVTVTLLSQENRPIEVMTGSISIGEELSPTQLFIMKEWFFTCGAVGTLVLFCLQGMTLLAAIAFYNHKLEQRQQRLKREEEEQEQELLSPSIDLGSDVASQQQQQDDDDINREDREEESFDLGSDVGSQQQQQGDREVEEGLEGLDV